ncbi:MAG TPA: hypothetical protein VFT19_00090 [Solirubrobacterales bacterium]|nr:hypothetical protein [Solirubrobacterales bacterium]
MAGSATGEGFKARGDEYRGRAGALTLFRIATREEQQPALPEEDEAFVAEQLERWLDGCPHGPLSIGAGYEAGDPLTALLNGWCSTEVHAIAVRGDAPEWLRLAIAPLAAAARLEFQLPQGETAPITPLDVEAAFLLTLPLIELPEEITGTCRLTVPVPGRRPQLAGVVVLVEDGEITSVSTDLTIDSNNFATAPPGAWIDTLIDPEAAAVGYGGDPWFAFSLLHGLHEKLFAVGVG